jgi:hypothetical protein
MKKTVALFIVLLTVLISGCSSTPANQEESTNPSNSKVNTEDDVNNVEHPSIGYEIIYTLSDKRFDKGINYYVLLDPVDLANSTFQDEIKLIVDELVRLNGDKVSIDFYDNREVLELDYKLYGDLSLERNTTEDENELLARHHIAGFSGDLSTGLFLNTLYFFPNTDSSHPEVGSFVTTIEYNCQIS